MSTGVLYKRPMLIQISCTVDFILQVYKIKLFIVCFVSFKTKSKQKKLKRRKARRKKWILTVRRYI